MKQILSDKDKNELEKLIAEAESRTKAQIILATTRRSDSYAEIPWKAFAFSSSLAGLTVFVSHLLMPVWISFATVLYTLAAILGTGGCCALLTIVWPAFARLFLSASRTETETRQYAESLFLRRELFKTNGRRGILMLVSLFEKRVVILPDKGLGNRLTDDDLKQIISAEMAKPLARGTVRQALENGLMALIRILEPTATTGPVSDELPDEIINLDEI